jgi:hypothetical protein
MRKASLTTAVVAGIAGLSGIWDMGTAVQNAAGYIPSFNGTHIKGKRSTVAMEALTKRRENRRAKAKLVKKLKQSLRAKARRAA